MSDVGLLKLAIEGDADALTTLLREHGPAIERTLRIDRVWQTMLEPADVMQITYLEAFLQIRDFDAGRFGSFEAWLRRIAENNLRDAIRGLTRQKQPQPRDRVRPMTDGESIAGLADLLGVTTTTPSQHVRRDEAHGALERAIEALPEDYAVAVRMYDLQGQTIADVAAALGRSTGAVHMLRARAHDRLREQLGGPSQFFSSGA